MPVGNVSLTRVCRRTLPRREPVSWWCTRSVTTGFQGTVAGGHRICPKRENTEPIHINCRVGRNNWENTFHTPSGKKKHKKSKPVDTINHISSPRAKAQEYTRERSGHRTLGHRFDKPMHRPTSEGESSNIPQISTLRRNLRSLPRVIAIVNEKEKLWS